MAALKLVFAVGLMVTYLWPFAPQNRTGRASDNLVLGVAVVLACLALVLLFGGLSAVIKELKDRWRYHR